jgi:hypothetical protein
MASTEDAQHPPEAVLGSRGAARGKAKIAKMKVTSMATEVASSSRRTNDGVFRCPGTSPCHIGDYTC